MTEASASASIPPIVKSLKTSVHVGKTPTTIATLQKVNARPVTLKPSQKTQQITTSSLWTVVTASQKNILVNLITKRVTMPPAESTASTCTDTTMKMENV